jgi:hypothetical protein
LLEVVLVEGYRYWDAPPQEGSCHQHSLILPTLMLAIAAFFHQQIIAFFHQKPTAFFHQHGVLVHRKTISHLLALLLALLSLSLAPLVVLK